MRVAAFLRRWRNTIFSTADHLWLLILWAVSTPVFIFYLGADRFGIWILINAIVGLGGVMSLGFGEATIRYVALYRGQNKLGDVSRIIDTTLALYAAIGVLSAVGISAAADAIATSAFKLSDSEAVEAVLALRLAGLALLITAYLKTYEAVINGFERFDLTARVGMATRSFIILGNLALVLMGFGLAALIACAVLGLVGQTIVYFLICRRSFVPELKVVSLPDWATTREIASFGLQSWLQICAGALNTLADRFLVAAMIDPAAAGIYAVCLQLAQQIHLLLARGLAFMMPETSRGDGGTDGLTKRLRSYRGGATLVLLMAGVVALPMYALASQILTIWVGADFAAAGTETLQIMTLYFAASGGVVPMYFLLNGAGHPAWNTAATLIHSIAGLALAAALLPAMGLPGAAWGRLATLPAFLVILWALHRYVLQSPGWRTSAIMIAWLLVVGTTAWGVSGFTSGLVPATVFGVLGGGTLLAFLGGCLAILPYVVAKRWAPPIPPAQS